MGGHYGALIHVIHVIHSRKGRDSAWRDSGNRVTINFRDEERTDRKEGKFGNAATAEADTIFGSEVTKAMVGPSGKKREAQADPNFLVRPCGTGGFGRRNRERESVRFA
jgi:hypothetical protein